MEVNIDKKYFGNMDKIVEKKYSVDWYNILLDDLILIPWNRFRDLIYRNTILQLTKSPK